MAWSLIHARVHTLLRKRRLLPKHSRVLIAVSGGQDSLCLARLLIDLRSQWEWSLGMMHCDHRWRTDSAENAAYVVALAHQWQVPAQVKVASIPPQSEAAARQWRYETLATVAREQGYTHVVTGHTASDRAETVLYNLIRGSGMDGMGAIPWQRPIDGTAPTVMLIRPLLDLRRQDTAQFCQQQNITVWADSSNQDLRLRRNRIRQELLPYLRQHFNPQVEQALAHTAEVTIAETTYLEAQAAHLYQRTITQTSSQPEAQNEWLIDCPSLCIEPLALQRRVIRQLLTQALLKAPNFSQIENLRQLIDAPNRSQSAPFPGGLIAQVRNPYLWLGHMTTLKKLKP
ncbi:MAG: tRNA lysidine(34) synthetase TilS [Phormidesmis sp. RL_2_1]|nr:tRNA lysidine(34) synthetase TilS [Phormidesmis sp. RL_2_1]